MKKFTKGTVMVDYQTIVKQVESLAEGENDFVPLLSNAVALLYEAIDRINWAGFYLMDRGSLLLGPFQGKAACVRIPLGKGVCGTAARADQIQRVEDVHVFPGHIACDAASASEIVLPLHSGGKVVGVLDIDSPEQGRFSPEDEEGLLRVVRALERGADFSRLRL